MRSVARSSPTTIDDNYQLNSPDGLYCSRTGSAYDNASALPDVHAT